MSKLQVDNISNSSDDGAVSFPYGVNLSGVTSATSLTISGNVQIEGDLTIEGTQITNNTQDLIIADKLVGIASTSTASDVTADGAGFEIFDGDQNKTWTYNNSKKSFNANIPIDNDETRLRSTAEKVAYTTNSNTATIDFSAGDGNIVVVKGATGNITLDVLNIPVTSEFNAKVMSFTVAVVQGSTGYIVNSVQLNGTSKTLIYPAGTAPTANTNCIDYFSVIVIDTEGDGAIASYKVTGNLNGNYPI